MSSFKSLRIQAQALLNQHKDDATMREFADLLVNMTKLCGDLRRQVKSLENELRGLKRKPSD